ncbi:hypothetical protein AYO20_03767 [Fonsecaea nubica]|uniref:PH domain-containing protein n=1 Tax=Fonsecaea nubica TaxID=856822 RepID=A0A178D4N2_9EURO|nr:hypothetical protein AYO20_03767 [Fonsecaea nubica]OAL36998.1 hypothetical protein AYO20_03767 [Fonsecaea nubica]
MSVEAPKPVEETPVVEPSKVVPEQPETTAEPTEAAATPADTTEATPAVAEEPAAVATEEVKKDEPAAEIVPASEGVLGYKEPTFFKKFIFSKHYFWFQEEPSTAESLTNFLRSEKVDTKHSDAAWARETGKGLLFYSKRVEDKATPAGIINLFDASNVTKEGLQFSFKAGAHVHRFEASSAKERDSWIAALEKATAEAKSLKEELTASESYKKNVEEYSKPAVAPIPAAVKASRSKSKEPKKSVDASTAAAAAAADATTGDAEETTKPAAERSQSRKRGSIFGGLLNKKEEHVEKKEEKPEVPAKDDAKETPEVPVEASTASAVPAPIVASDKKEEKEDASPTEKNRKRGSVFGNLFRNRVGSPTTEKSEKDALTTSDVPPVSETAPKIEEPIENKPIDAAAVTAPVDTVTTPPVEEPAAASEASAAPKTEKKGGLISFIKKTEAKLEGKKETKEETKEEKAAEAIAKDPVAAASTEPTEPAASTEAAAETATPATEERPARDNKRRTSLFFNKKQHEATEGEDTVAEPKREKSPLPGGKFIGQLVRRASKAIKSEGPKEKTPAEPAAPAAASTTEAPASETPAIAPEAAEAKPVEPVPEPIQSTPEAVVTTAPEVKATA